MIGYKKLSGNQLMVTVDDKPIKVLNSYDKKKKAVVIEIPATSVKKQISIKIEKGLQQMKNSVQENCFEFLNQAEIQFALKDRIFAAIQKESRIPILIAQLQAMELDDKLLAVLVEQLTAKNS